MLTRGAFWRSVNAISRRISETVQGRTKVTIID